VPAKTAKFRYSQVHLGSPTRQLEAPPRAALPWRASNVRLCPSRRNRASPYIFRYRRRGWRAALQVRGVFVLRIRGQRKIKAPASIGATGAQVRRLAGRMGPASDIQSAATANVNISFGINLSATPRSHMRSLRRSASSVGHGRSEIRQQHSTVGASLVQRAIGREGNHPPFWLRRAGYGRS
jgi:hypothetical protein